MAVCPVGVMADSLTVAPAELVALATGATIVAITQRHAVDLNDELTLTAEGDDRTDITGLVVAIQPAASMIEQAGDAVLLRVFAGPTPVLDDEAFSALRSEVEARWK